MLPNIVARACVSLARLYYVSSLGIFLILVYDVNILWMSVRGPLHLAGSNLCRGRNCMRERSRDPAIVSIYVNHHSGFLVGRLPALYEWAGGSPTSPIHCTAFSRRGNVCAKSITLPKKNHWNATGHYNKIIKMYRRRVSSSEVMVDLLSVSWTFWWSCRPLSRSISAPDHIFHWV